MSTAANRGERLKATQNQIRKRVPNFLLQRFPQHLMIPGVTWLYDGWCKLCIIIYHWLQKAVRKPLKVVSPTSSPRLEPTTLQTQSAAHVALYLSDPFRLFPGLMPKSGQVVGPDNWFHHLSPSSLMYHPSPAGNCVLLTKHTVIFPLIDHHKLHTSYTTQIHAESTHSD